MNKTKKYLNIICTIIFIFSIIFLFKDIVYSALPVENMHLATTDEVKRVDEKSFVSLTPFLEGVQNFYCTAYNIYRSKGEFKTEGNGKIINALAVQYESESYKNLCGWNDYLGSNEVLIASTVDGQLNPTYSEDDNAAPTKEKILKEHYIMTDSLEDYQNRFTTPETASQDATTESGASKTRQDATWANFWIDKGSATGDTNYGGEKLTAEAASYAGNYDKMSVASSYGISDMDYDGNFEVVLNTEGDYAGINGAEKYKFIVGPFQIRFPHGQSKITKANGEIETLNYNGVEGIYVGGKKITGGILIEKDGNFELLNEIKYFDTSTNERRIHIDEQAGKMTFMDIAGQNETEPKKFYLIVDYKDLIDVENKAVKELKIEVKFKVLLLATNTSEFVEKIYEANNIEVYANYVVDEAGGHKHGDYADCADAINDKYTAEGNPYVSKDEKVKCDSGNYGCFPVMNDEDTTCTDMNKCKNKACQGHTETCEEDEEDCDNWDYYNEQCDGHTEKCNGIDCDNLGCEGCKILVVSDHITHRHNKVDKLIVKADSESEKDQPGNTFKIEGIRSEDLLKDRIAKYNKKYDFNMVLSGNVWEILRNDGKSGVGNTEKGLGTVKVIAVSKEYKIEYFTTSDNNGYWEIQVLPELYDVYFEYNGMRYQAITENGGQYVNDDGNKALEAQRDYFNDKFKNVSWTNGEKTEGGNNNGYKNSTSWDGMTGRDDNSGKLDEEINKQYFESVSSESSIKAPVHILITADTNTAFGDTYPEDKNFIVPRGAANTDSEPEKTIEIAGKTYYSVDPGCRDINLKVYERSKANAMLWKDVYVADITINHKQMQYKYNKYNLNQPETWTIDITERNNNNKTPITYNLNLYKSDYNFKIDDYRITSEKITNNVGNETFGKSYDDELRVYITYVIRLYNASPDSNDNIYIDTINDYFDETYTLIKEDIKYETQLGPNSIVAEDPAGATVNGEVQNTDGKNKVELKVEKTIASNEYHYIYLTFEVNKDGSRNIKQGEKTNFVEINSYSINDENGKATGKIDYNSIPGNYAKKGFPTTKQGGAEDDEYAAPGIIVNVDENKRTLKGFTWEDARSATTNIIEEKTYTANRGNGIFNINDTYIYNNTAVKDSKINDVTVQLIELVKVEEKTYEYIWREMQTGAKEYFYIDNTGDVNGNYLTNNEGEYEFNSFIPGNYIIRFKYGDKIIDENVDKQKYNGQDYKSTKYMDNKYMDEMTNLTTLSTANDSNAIDNERRRLELIDYSRKINYDIGSKENTQDSNYIYDIDKSWMYADTLKFQVKVEPEVDETELETVGYSNEFTYTFANIDFGIEERPQTIFKIQKHINRIQIILQNGTTIIDTEDSNKMKNIQFIDKDNWKKATDNITIFLDEEIMHGAQIKIDYEMNLINESQVDITSNTIDAVLTSKEQQIALKNFDDRITYLNNLETNKNPERHRINNPILGDYYYTGNANNQKVVVTKVHRVVDYVDNNLVYREADNTATDYSNWKLITDEERKDDTTYFSPNVRKEKYSQLIVNNKQAQFLKPGSEGYNYKLRLVKELSQGNIAEELVYENSVEILEYENSVGRKDINATPGNQKEHDWDDTAKIIITKPTGGTKEYNYTSIILISVMSLIIITAGVFIIKRKVI